MVQIHQGHFEQWCGEVHRHLVYLVHVISVDDVSRVASFLGVTCWMFFWLCGFWIWSVIWTVRIWTDPEHRGSKETVLCPLGWKLEISGLEGHWVVNYSAEACGHCVKVCLVVLLLKRELDSLPECLRWWWSGWPLGDHVGYPGFRDLGNFLQGEIFLEGEQTLDRLSASNFAMLP